MRYERDDFLKPRIRFLKAKQKQICLFSGQLSDILSQVYETWVWWKLGKSLKLAENQEKFCINKEFICHWRANMARLDLLTRVQSAETMAYHRLVQNY